ncbi:hypothetical protein Pse7367_1992 [Thalassoporum mexicanum PCC 7367]|uniref:hypothetical protein n=1 Tax=Thalassoporum mexicanum TaxID=3457544 RepID=UPI00029FD50F|nr:hypothetical protein [Pseudanabaena sp. PCC 7367]AFY70265.1 hypothetical protein Pse7367_1992 [Pseudanabaena sp. PCC 7367]
MHTLSPASPASPAKSNQPESKAIAKAELSQSEMLQSALTGLDTTLEDELSRYHHWQDNGQSFSYLNAYQPLKLSMSEEVRNAIASDRPITPGVDNPKAAAPVEPKLPPKLMVDGHHLPLPMEMAASAGASHRIAQNSNGNPSIQSNQPPTMPIMPNTVDPEATQIGSRFYGDDDQETVEVNLNPSNANANGSLPNSNLPNNSLIDEQLLQEINQGYDNNNTAPYAPEDAPVPPVAPEEEEAQFTITSPLGIAAMFLLLMASAVVGYLLVRPSDFANMLNQQQSQRDLQREADITLRAEHDIDSLLADEEIFPDLPYATLPGDNGIPGQSLDKFTAISPDITESLNDLPSVSALPPELEPSLDSLSSLPPVTDLPDYNSYNPPAAIPPRYDSYVEPAVKIRPQQNYSRPAPVAKRAPQAPPKLSTPPIQNIETATSSPNFIPPNSSPSRSNKPIAIQPLPTQKPNNAPANQSNKPAQLEHRGSVVSATIEKSNEGRYSQQLKNSPNRVSNPAQSRTVSEPANNIPVQYAPLLSAESARANNPAPAPAPTRAIAPPAPSTSRPVNNPVHKVVVDQSYANQTQQIDQNAYVRPSDGKLQVGAYNDASAAQQRIEELRRQGIPAQLD